MMPQRTHQILIYIFHDGIRKTWCILSIQNGVLQMICQYWTADVDASNCLLLVLPLQMMAISYVYNIYTIYTNTYIVIYMNNSPIVVWFLLIVFFLMKSVNHDKLLLKMFSSHYMRIWFVASTFRLDFRLLFLNWCSAYKLYISKKTFHFLPNQNSTYRLSKSADGLRHTYL